MKWFYFIYFFCVESVFFLWKCSHFSLKTELKEDFCQNLTKHWVQWKVDFFILEIKEAFLFWFYLCFQERTKHLPATFTLKAGKVKVLEYLRKLGRDLKSFSSNLPLGCTYIIWDNESMDDTDIKALKSHEKKLWNWCQFLALNSPNCGGSCQQQIQIPPNPRQDLSTLKCNPIQSLDLNSAVNTSLLSSNAFKKHQRHQNIQSGQIQLVQQNTSFKILFFIAE